MSKYKKITNKVDFGRPSIYDNNYHPNVLYALFWENLNLSLQDIAKEFNVSTVTINTWLNTHEDFLDAWNKCRSGIKGILIQAGIKAAVGHYKFNQVLNKKDEIVELKVWHQPQPSILKLLLSNFAIREKTEVVNTVEVNDELYNKAVKSLNDAELEQLHALIEKIEKQ